ncbi:MAG: NAD(P)-dependent glycerol-3-phosphate dehydrogenase [Planctomycetes bacterium]|nr:NAD(P)-dependent glycerol-3-phosphate dehydrogenase [Planctomycetota bacterium]
MELLVIGAGAMGTSLAGVFQENNPTSLWVRRPEQLNLLAQDGENSTYLPGYKIPSNIKLVSGDVSFNQYDVIISCIPTQKLRDTVQKLKLHEFNGPVISTSKGLELGSFKTPCEVLEDIGLAKENVYTLTGPSHAEEICRSIPTSVVLAGIGKELPEELLKAMSGKSFRPYYSADRLGAELGGALKNIIAIATGVSEGLGFGMNTISTIITRGLSEIKRYGYYRKANRETFNGLSCLGDLVTTCCSPHSRNRAFGIELVTKKNQPYTKLAEGVHTAKSLIAEIDQLDFDMPLCRAVYEIACEQKEAKEVIRTLLNRPLKEED